MTQSNGKGHTGTDKDIHGQTEIDTDRQGQTGSCRDQQGQTGTRRDKSAGKNRDKSCRDLTENNQE